MATTYPAACPEQRRDRADRITSATTPSSGISYTVNTVSNMTARGPDTLAYDQANRWSDIDFSGNDIADTRLSSRHVNPWTAAQGSAADVPVRLQAPWSPTSPRAFHPVLTICLPSPLQGGGAGGRGDSPHGYYLA